MRIHNSEQLKIIDQPLKLSDCRFRVFRPAIAADIADQLLYGIRLARHGSLEFSFELFPEIEFVVERIPF